MNEARVIDNSYLFPNGLPQREKKKRGPYKKTKLKLTFATHMKDSRLDWFWGISESMRSLKKDLQFNIQSDLNALIIGETGTGKEIIAKKIHEDRRLLEFLADDKCPFISVNCANIPESLSESILFGHVRGAFTSARDKQIGKFEMAKEGTLFLDEIQNLSLDVQSKLLRVLQSREAERLGSSEPYKVKCKIIAASNVPLEILVNQNKFRKDLYYRLTVCPIYIPSLRNRKEDLPSIMKGLLEKVCRELQCEIPEISPDAYQIISAHPWPGNLRELEHALTYSVLRAEDLIEVQHLPPSITGRLAHYLNTGDWS